MLTSAVRDAGYALRPLRRSLAVFAVGILTLGLGIGANVGLFAVVRGVVLQPLPYPQAERLVRIWPEVPHARAFFERLRQQSGSYDDVSAYASSVFTVSGEGVPEEVVGARAAVSHFDVLGVRPLLGRGFHRTRKTPPARRW